jgi:hypothetical protein
MRKFVSIHIKNNLLNCYEEQEQKHKKLINYRENYLKD